MKKRETISGMTVVEIAIIFAIVGIILAGGYSVLNGVVDQVRYTTTRDRMEKVMKAFGAYAQQNYYLPCPAAPPLANGRVTGIGYTDCRTVPARIRGIVPYAELGLTEEQAKDSYGNYLTYVVNPLVATSAIHSLTYAGDACRTEKWVRGTNPPGTVNKNPRKARFCCANDAAFPVANDPRIQDRIGGADLGLMRAGISGDVNQVSPILSNYSQAISIVLISHGRNEFGAYLSAAAPTRKPAPPGATYRPQEVENTNDDNIYISGRYSINEQDPANSYFDDIIMWRTQTDLLASMGRDSCTQP